MKKVLALLLALSMMISLFAGCSSEDKKETNDGASTQKDSGEKAEKEENEDPVDLTWYTIGTPQQDVDLVEEELNKYLLEKINATVDLVQLDWGEYTQKMQVKIGSGESFDLMFTCSWANDFATNVARGALLPLNDLIDEYGAGIKENLHPLFLEGATINGEIYALPTNKELGWQAMWIINKDLADKYDMDLSGITTLESLEPYLQIIKDNEPGIIPLSLDKEGLPYTPNLDGGILGGDMPLAIKFDDPTTVVNKYETEEFMNVSNTMYDYDQKGFLHPDRGINTLREDVKAGNYFIAKAHYQPYAEIIWANGAFSGTPIEIRPVHEPYADSGSTRGAMQGVSVTSEHPEKAMELLNLLYTDEYVINLIDFGIEGTHYEKLEGDYINQLDRGKDSYAFPAFSVGNLLNTYSYEGTPADKWEKFQEFNDACINAPTLGFTPDLDSVKNQIASVTNVNEEFVAMISLGVVDPEEYTAKLNEKLYAAGLDEIIAEVQKQYDAWLAGK